MVELKIKEKEIEELKKRIHKLEKEVKMVLDKNKIEYEEQKTFDWLRNKTKLSLDFYLPKYNIFIECQGRQHFIPVSTFGGEKGFEETKKRDLIKYQKCIEHGIIPLYYSNKKWKYCNGEKTINDLNKLIDKIKKEHPDFKVILGNEIYLCRDGLNGENFDRGNDRYYRSVG